VSAAGLVDDPRADVAEAGQALEHRDEQVALLVDDVEARADGVQRRLDGAGAGGQGARERVRAVQRPVDLRPLCVEPAEEGVQLGERAADGGLPALQRETEFPVDRLELRQTAAVQDQREGTEEFLDLDVPVGPRQRDVRVVAQAPLRLLVAGSRELDELLPQQRRLLDLRHRVRGEVDVAVDESVTSAVQSSWSSILSTRPTGTSATLTPDCCTRSRTSRNSTCTVYG
jgi:hypothetical protein